MKNEALQTVFERAYLEIINYQNVKWDNLAARSDDGMRQAIQADTLQKAKEALHQTNDIGQKNAQMASETGKGITSDGVIEVQYNPSTVSISGTMEERKTEAEEQRRKITTITTVGVVSLSVELVFHSTSAKDTSVADQMNMLLAMMQKSSTKRVRFSWGNMQVNGRVTSFKGKYDLFHASGLPASGSIQMTIQADSEPKKIEKKIEAMTEERKEKMQRE